MLQEETRQFTEKPKQTRCRSCGVLIQMGFKSEYCAQCLNYGYVWIHIQKARDYLRRM